MDVIMGIIIGTQFIFTIITGLYFYNNLKSQNNSKTTIEKLSKGEVARIGKLRGTKLTKPLSEKTRPTEFSEIIGQEKGIRALKASICGENPQHVIIYGPAGVGKTAAARMILEYARSTSDSPFTEQSPFIEVDSTILQFDERSIADPLIGSVHDPIYQGAGAFGQIGVPQPKEGAVTKAHGGILFLDEIGELHQVQMNKLLKVLEDRKVFLNSTYYMKGDKNTPDYIHDIFQNGLPADFRLIGATTRSPEEIPEALRSRCTEIFFRSLNQNEVQEIAKKSFHRAGGVCSSEGIELISKYTTNGRDTVNIVEMSYSIASLSKRTYITVEDIEDVLEYGRYTPAITHKVADGSRVGVINAMAVIGSGKGTIMEMEVLATPTAIGKKGEFEVTGIIEEEELKSYSGKMKKPGSARNSVSNVKTSIEQATGLTLSNYNIHINFPGGMPIDGPSAGISMYTALYSALTDSLISCKIAMTGEISIRGKVKPVGGVMAKIEAAIESGIETVYIPKSNYQNSFKKLPIEIICVETVDELVNHVFKNEFIQNEEIQSNMVNRGNIALASQEKL